MNDMHPEPAGTPTPKRDLAATQELSTSAGHGQGAAGLPQRLGDFTILGVLGEGGMGTVYLAEDPRLGRKAAIKTMRPELAARPENRARFLREARAAAAVEHDHIVAVWQVGEPADGSPFIVMPFLQGETLEARLQREPVQPPAVILKVAGEVAEALAAAHARGLIHRDVKPGNVWLEGDPAAVESARQIRRCKVLDFGLARCAEAQDVQVTASGMVLGTPDYMAPEQARGEAVGPQADLFSLGVMLYRMATGRLPFAGPNAMAVLTALATIVPPPARALRPNLPQALSDLIGRLMSKGPTGRPRSAAEVAEEVLHIGENAVQADAVGAPEEKPAAAGQTSEDTIPLRPRPAQRPTRRAGRARTRLLVGLGLLAMVSLGAWLLMDLLRARPADTASIGEIKGPKEEARVPVGAETAKEDLGLDRKAAEWVLSVGGTVRVNGQGQDLRAAAKLPPGPFRLTWAWLLLNGPGDADLACFRGCRNLTGLGLQGAQVSDASLAHFAGCKGLKMLVLSGKRVTDAGVAYFAGCKDLVELNLADTQVTDAGLAAFRDCKELKGLGLAGGQFGDLGLAHFKDCRDLKGLDLRGTQVTDVGLACFAGCKGLTGLGLWQSPRLSDAGLAVFKDCKDLRALSLSDTPVTDAGLAAFRDCRNLTHLTLAGTQVGDAGLAHLGNGKGLTAVDLRGTRVSDAGLAFLMDCQALTYLDLKQTKVTPAKVEHLKKALPQCRIEWDGR